MSQLESKVHLLEFNPDEHRQHIVITDQAACQNCGNKPCLTLCPSAVFAWNNCSSDPVLVFYKQCVECGACRLICPFENIEFSYPRGDCGVAYHEG